MSLIKCSIVLSLFSYVLVGSFSSHGQHVHKDLLSSLNIKQDEGHKDKHKPHKVDQVQLENIRLQKLSSIAQYFGIDTTNKTVDQLRQEIEQAKIDQPEKWAMLKTKLHEKKLKLLEQKSTAPIK